MNLLLLDPGELDGNHALVRGPRARYLAEVHRAGVGRVLRAGVLGGLVGTAVVQRITGDAVELGVALDREPPAPLPCTLALALPRPKVLRRVLGAVAAFGIKRIALFGALRVEKSYWQSPLAADDAVRDELLRGLEQAGDTVLPQVTKHARFRPFVEDEFPALAAGSTALLAHPRAEAPCPRGVDGPITLAVGPEGGFVDFELQLLVAAGCRPVSLGTRPLRVEHAVAALIGRLS